MPQFLAAAVQTSSKLFDFHATITLFEQKLIALKKLGVDLAVFPEAFFGGYPKGVDFGVRVGSRNDAGRDLFGKYDNAAIARGSGEIRTICKLVQKANLNVVVGLIEKDGGTLYCVSVTISRKGDILAWHRKLMPTAMERIIWGFGDGSTLEIAKADIGYISTAICWENYMPLYRAHLYAQGTQIHCVPTVDDRSVWLPTMQMIALEGRCFVISACQYMTMADVDDATFIPIQGTSPDTVLINGGSCIISPFGEVLAAPVFGKQEIVTAMIDLDEITKGKFDLDVSGHYARPDIFNLSVNTSPQNSVTLSDKPKHKR